MDQGYKIIITAFVCLLTVFTAKSQVTISGTVYDSTKTIPVKGVLIKTSNGNSFVTDSTGRYTIIAATEDSLSFVYENKPTMKFAVRQMLNTGVFDIALHIRISDKYRTLKEVKVYGKSYKQDSIANREQYAKIFNYEKPGISLSSNSYSGAAGMDLDEFINIFRFRRNRQLKKMQERLQEQEKESYVNYRFNKIIVRRITQLKDADLEKFMNKYRPNYDFALNSSLPEFYQYILTASYEFKQQQEEEKFVNSRFNKESVQLITNLQHAALDEFMKKYRPSYTFAFNSSVTDFYEYIHNAFEHYQKEKSTNKTTSDSLEKH